MNLRGVSFDWQDPEMEGRQIGFIAQETMDVIPEVVSGTEQMNYSMQYGPITAVLVEAVKGGFEEAGQTMPQALASNIRRVEKAGIEWVRKIKETGLALNNKLLDALEVPKASASKGRPKAEEKPEPAKTPTDLRGDTLEGAKHMLRALLAGKNKVCSTAIIDKYENALTECLALLSAK